jgi:N-acetylglucosamine-6-phosphate deacetylase
VHPAEWIILPSVEFFSGLLREALGMARILTLAPELPGAIHLIAAARQAGVVVSMGHTDANYEQARAAITAGATHAAHVYNAMRPFSHRGTGVIGAVLTAPEVSAELIADGIHVDEAAMRMLIGLKSPDHVILVSDAISATGMPDGKYRLGMFEVAVKAGVCRNSEGKLAGSTLTLDRALRNIVALGVPLGSAIRMLTANPARQIGLGGRKGTLASGADADFVFLNDKLEVTDVMTRGVGLQ